MIARKLIGVLDKYQRICKADPQGLTDPFEIDLLGQQITGNSMNENYVVVLFHKTNGVVHVTKKKPRNTRRHKQGFGLPCDGAQWRGLSL